MSDLPHVTDLIRDSGLVDTRWCTQEHLDKGSAVHLATRYLDEGTLDRSTVDQRVLPRLEQYEKFKRESGVEILAIEQYVQDRILGYQGTFDRAVRFGTRTGLLDIKGVTKSPWHGVQLAAYRWASSFGPERWALYLSDNDYEPVEYKSRLDWEMFKATITHRNWRSENGLAIIDRDRTA